MTVYIVQKLDWKYDDAFYCLYDDEPVKAFAKKHDAEVYQPLLEKEARESWQGQGRYCIGENGDCDEPDAFFEIVALELES
ncbi:hypothetical protein [Armatimonas rosea]|uniref:Uncharacterized protein n=1 Tax=Armatimonas rosea TaxID=685828 RepID=A0A7W9SN50_ARMRO|nr:hypothetical protein [Armatimonas rosea]MBB6048913.1 hypothetical protein [Armatimonas rosea]